jgi:putative transposase
MSVFKRYELQFFTATILEWKPLLQLDKYKDIIIDSLKFLVKDGRVAVLGFVIMNNHLHLIWQIKHPHKREDVQRDFLKFTAQTIKFDLIEHHPLVLEHFKVDAKDRQYQIWERNPLSVDIWTEAVLYQKLNYVHENPVKAGLVTTTIEYLYSSARFFETGVDDWGFLTMI